MLVLSGLLENRLWHGFPPPHSLMELEAVIAEEALKLVTLSHCGVLAPHDGLSPF